ncbi:MAG: hypothetical protein ABL888_19230 [Pirellulaceae bacterium]
MTENRFELELEQRLRAVDIPADLKTRLLCIPDDSDDITISAPASDLRSSRKLGQWFVAIAASTLGAACLIGWWALSVSNREAHDSLAHINPTPSAKTTIDKGTALAEEVSNLESLDRQLAALKREYEQLETSLANHALPERPLSPASHFDNDEFLASVILNTAETCAATGIKTNAVKEQLEYLVKRFERTSSAELARNLLASFE